MAHATGLDVTAAMTVIMSTTCVYDTADGSGQIQTKTFPGAVYDSMVASETADGTGFGPVSGVGAAAYEGAGGLYVKADSGHAFQIFSSGKPSPTTPMRSTPPRKPSPKPCSRTSVERRSRRPQRARAG